MRPGLYVTSPTGLRNANNFVKQQLRKRLEELKFENAALAFHVLAPLIKQKHMNVFSGGSNLPHHMTVTRANRQATYNKISKVRREMANIKRQLGIK
jgi:hypothetical protein